MKPKKPKRKLRLCERCGEDVSLHPRKMCAGFVSGGVVRGPSTAKAVTSDLRHLTSELDRLKAGHFTPDEFQNLCHKLEPELGADKFCLGCEEYQHRLFGFSPITTLKHENHTMREQQERLLNALTSAINWWRQLRSCVEAELPGPDWGNEPPWVNEAHAAIANLQWPKVPV